MRLSVFVFVAVLTSACAVATAVPPQTAPAALSQAADAPYFTTQPYDPRWWRQFEDPVLEQLETAALAANYDVRVAVARM
jgi:multidrug efflux system outer membrane protein